MGLLGRFRSVAARDRVGEPQIRVPDAQEFQDALQEQSQELQAADAPVKSRKAYRELRDKLLRQDLQWITRGFRSLLSI